MPTFTPIEHEDRVETTDGLPGGDARDLARLRRVEHSLDMLELLQKNYRRSRFALEPYLRSACDAYERLDVVDVAAVANDDERQRLLDTCDALERLMRIWQRSRETLSRHVAEGTPQAPFSAS